MAMHGTRVSRSGVNETLSVPKHNADTGSANVSGSRSLDTSFRSLNSSLMSVGRTVGKLQTKVEKLDDVSTDVCEVKERLSSIESAIASQTQLLGDIFTLLKLATDPDGEATTEVVEAIEATDATANDDATVDVNSSDEEFDLE